MVGASKILTVSYGTFSCTLEGFDDPFNTMKAIAEYFRDLAADDRYFGAEPPQPDPAMLGRIAEREVQRRVETRIDETGVTLRAGGNATPQVPAPAPQPKPEPVLEPALSAATDEESVAAKLLRIRAAVAKSRAAAIGTTAVVAPAAPVIAEPIAFKADEETEAAEPEDMVIPQTEALNEMFAAEAEEEVEAEEDTAAQAEVEQAEEEPALEAEIAEEEVVSFAETYDEPVEDVAVEEVAVEEVVAAAEEPVAIEEIELVSADAEDEVVLSVAEMEDAQPEAEAPSEVEVEDILPEETTAFADEPALDIETDEILFANFASMGLGSSETVDATNEAAEVEITAEEDADLGAFLNGLAEESAPAEEVEADAAPMVHARLVKVRRETAIEEEDDTSVDLEDDTQDDDARESFLMLSDDDEADLQRELDSVEFESAEVDPFSSDDLASKLGETLSGALADEDTSLGHAGGKAGRRILEESGDEDSSLDRLLTQTNSALEHAESRRKISTISHLKAAVAATFADRLSLRRKTEDEAEAATPYRDDLARVVRPRRPVSSESTERPSAAPIENRPAPLVLISEQRIDRPSGQPHSAPNDQGPIRPRRIGVSGGNGTNGNLALREDDDALTGITSFAEFAEKMGATELPELMEAAAAYATCFEDRPMFSRPELLRQVNEHNPAPIDGNRREDNLRSFGVLLRSGKIEKIKRGQFALTDSSRFLTEARKMLD